MRRATLCSASWHRGQRRALDVTARDAARLSGGGALTLFLHEPLTALCALCAVQPPISPAVLATAWEAVAEATDELSLGLARQLHLASLSSGRPPHAALLFLSDPFLRTQLVRFLICAAAYDLCKATRHLQQTGELLPPRCAPALPPRALYHEAGLAAVRKATKLSEQRNASTTASAPRTSEDEHGMGARRVQS